MKVRTLLGLLLVSVAPAGIHGQAMAADGDILAEIVRTRPLIESRKTPAIIHLEHKGGFPVMPEELEAQQHGEWVDLLMLDPTMTDYQHLHPNPMGTPGNYVFTVTPKTPCDYKLWVGVKPEAGAQQYAVTEMPGAEKCKLEDMERRLDLVGEGGNYKVKMVMDTDGLQVGQQTTLKLVVRDEGGRYIDELQPIFGSFGHLIGFNEDYKTVVMPEPLGELPTSHTDIGGPTLKYSFTPEVAGFYKLFARFIVKNHPVVVTFGLNVGGAEPDMWAADDWDKERISQAGVLPGAALSEPAVESEPERPARREDDLDRLMAAETEDIREENLSLDNLFLEREPQGEVEVYEDLEEKILDSEKTRIPNMQEPENETAKKIKEGFTSGFDASEFNEIVMPNSQ